MENKQAGQVDYQVLIIGAGVSGIGSAIELGKLGIDDYLILERADDLGGTWRDNRYPGVAVDIPSFSYSFSYELNPNWSRFFAPGDEIQRYVQSVADKYSLRRKIQFNTTVASARFDELNNVWKLELEGGSQLTARYLISCTGILNQPVRPDIDGLDMFAGKTIHTAQWNQDLQLQGKRVGIIGTGASAVQVVPSIADKVNELHVYQRTPIWVAPKFDKAIGDDLQRIFNRYPLSQKLARFMSECGLEFGAFAVTNYQRLPFLAKILEKDCLRALDRQVHDPEVRKKLTPHYGFGCKRPAISNTYLRSFNKRHVHLQADGISHITEKGIVDINGNEVELDIIILATGFKTLELGNSPSFDIIGLENRELGQWWHDERYQAYAGVAAPGFPNFFMTFGPYAGGLNWFAMLEANLKYISRCLKMAEKRNATYIEVKQQAHQDYFEKMQKMGKNAVFTDSACLSANSYYLDHHGDPSLPAPFSPLWRWLRVRFTPLNDFTFR